MDALSAFTHQICLVRGHFGHDEPIDFLVLLIGYAISGERVDTSGAARPQQAQTRLNGFLHIFVRILAQPQHTSGKKHTGFGQNL